jgi:hypothetical protein
MLNFPDRSASIFIVTVVFLGLSFIAVCLRCFVRLKLVKAFGWDDTIMVVAMALNILFALCGITGSLYGMGRKRAHVEQFSTALFWWWLGQTSYVVTCVVAKISIAVALLRLTVTNAYNPSVDCHRSDHRRRSCVLVRPDFAMQTGIIFLEPIITWNERNLPQYGHYHQHRLSLQCNCHTVRLCSWSFAHLAGLEAPNDAEDEDCIGCYS